MLLYIADNRSLKVAVQGPVLWPTPYRYTYIHCTEIAAIQKIGTKHPMISKFMITTCLKSTI
jgi:hypothetical protein